MIEVLKSKNGLEIAKFKGAYIHSSIDPVKEAESWSHHHYNLLVGVPHIIVSGCGFGYHLKALAELFPNQKIISIERIKEFQTASQNMLNSYSNVEVLSMDVKDLLNNECIRKAMSQLYLHVEIPSLIKTDKSYYEELREMFSGRTSRSLDFIIDCRKDHKEFFVRRPHIYKSPVISIKTINENLKQNNKFLTRQELIWKTLGELVK